MTMNVRNLEVYCSTREESGKGGGDGGGCGVVAMGGGSCRVNC